jgi:hypothetical protein
MEPASAPSSAPTTTQPEGTTPPPQGRHRATGINWAHGIRAATLAGAASALMLVTPVGNFGLGMLAGGFLAVVLYKRSTPGAELRPSRGAILGLVSGSIGSFLCGIVLALRAAIQHTGAALRAEMIRAIEQAAARTTDPQTQAAANWLKSPPGIALMLVLTVFFTFILFLVLSATGGAIAAVILRRRQRS